MNNFIISEILKHLPGRHSQKTHGKHHLPSPPQHLLDAWQADEEQSNVLTAKYERDVVDTIKSIGVQRAKLIALGDPRHPYTVDMVKAWEWQEAFHDQVRSQARFYRGVSSTELVNASKNGKLIAPVLQGTDSQDEFEYGKEGDPNISLTLSPLVAQDYGEFVLQVTGDKARQQGLFPRNYVGRFERIGGMSGIEEFEVEVPESLSLDSIEAVVYAEGNMEHYGKIVEDLEGYRRQAASYGVTPEQTEIFINEAITATEHYNEIFRTLKGMGIPMFLGDEE